MLRLTAAMLSVAATLPAAGAARSFIVQNDAFVQDGKVVQLRSGSIHYARVPSVYWEDRLRRLAALGLNSVTTYVPWNWHEEVEGEYNFSGDHDLEAFIKTAQKVGLLVLVRAGPYMCGEWEFGGFPAWILNHNVTIRTYEPNYIALVDKYWGELLPRIKPLLYSNGGPVVMVQMENEYGSYGDVSKNSADKQYMEHLVSIANSHFGKGSVVLYTTDGGNLGYMTRGSLTGDSVLTCGDGGWACDASAQFNPSGLNACMNTEDYTGWLTHWGEHVANTSAGDYGATKALQAGHSFNLYMGHGGTNFGWMSGANGGGKGYQAHITSYDYDSPVSENGDHGFGHSGHDKFTTLRDAIAKLGFKIPAEPAPLTRTAYGAVTLTHQARMLADANLAILGPKGKQSIGATPVPMESLGQNYGFIHYTATFQTKGTTFEIGDYPRDRAQVFVNGIHQGTIYRPDAAPLKLSKPVSAGEDLGILVENMGRLNYGRGMTDPKGINTPVTLDGANVAAAWEAQSLPLDYKQVAALNYTTVENCSAAGGGGPIFYRGTLQIDGEPTDTYLKPAGWGKGIMWVNGFNLGRYWEAQGPQHAFYAPAPYLKSGANDIVLLEVDQGSSSCVVHFDDKPDFSGKPAQPCKGTPSAGEVVRLRTCDSSLGEQQSWTLNGGKLRLNGGSLCLASGPAKDPFSGQPSATLMDCATAPSITAQGQAIKIGGSCLDVTSHGQVAGEPTEWYSCNGGSNQQWKMVDLPSHHQQLQSVEEAGQCLSACEYP